MAEQPLTLEERRDDLIRGRILPGLDRKHDHFAFRSDELAERFEGRGVEFLIQGLGPGWRFCSGQNGEVIVSNRDGWERAKEQIRQRFQPSRPQS